MNIVLLVKSAVPRVVGKYHNFSVSILKIGDYNSHAATRVNCYRVNATGHIESFIKPKLRE